MCSSSKDLAAAMIPGMSSVGLLMCALMIASGIHGARMMIPEPAKPTKPSSGGISNASTASLVSQFESSSIVGTTIFTSVSAVA